MVGIGASPCFASSIARSWLRCDRESRWVKIQTETVPDILQRDRCGALLQRYHGGPQQELARFGRIGSSSAELGEVLPADLGVARLQPLLIGDCLGLNELVSHGA